MFRYFFLVYVELKNHFALEASSFFIRIAIQNKQIKIDISTCLYTIAYNLRISQLCEKLLQGSL